MQNYQRFGRSVVAVMVVVVGLMVAVMTPAVQAASSSNPNPGVFPLNSNPYGNTYGEWSARWWQWTFSIPEATNPVLDETGTKTNCAERQSGQVWFLAGSFGGTFDRACTVPHGKALFFVILNAAFGAAVNDCEPTNPGVPCDVTALRAGAAAAVDSDSVEMEASIDGVPLVNLKDYRVQSPVFSVTLPEGNILRIPSGIYAPMVSDGYWLMLAPLSAGAHTIHYTGNVISGPFAGFTIEGTYHLTVGQ